MDDASLRDLDRRVHYEVLGLHCLHEDLGVEIYSLGPNVRGIGRKTRCRKCGLEGVETCPPMPYSAKIEWAWQVVAAMNGRGWLLNYLQQLRLENGIWCAEFTRPSEERREYADSAPLVICLAALAAVEGR